MGCACSHVAALLFKLQACTILELNKVASTSKLCSWKKSRQRAHPAPLTQISFKRPKKTDLVPDVITDVPHQLPSFSVRWDVIENDIETKEKLLELKKLSPNAVVLKSVLIESDDIDYDSEATISSDEREHCIPEPLTSFYEPDAINFSDEKLETYSRSAYNTFITCYNEDHYKNLCNITKQQSLSQAWNIHRAGRITASNSKMAFERKVESPSKTFFNQVMQYGSFFDVPATRHGKDMEPITRESFTEYTSKHHEHVLVKETGLHVHPNYLYIGASPYGIVALLMKKVFWR